MAWLEIKIETLAGKMEAAAAALTAGGFSDLVLEDQQEFESFLDQNRACWDYIDESLQQRLRGLSCVKLYLESEDEASLERLKGLLEKLRARGDLGELTMSLQPLAEEDWEEGWKENYPPQRVGKNLVVLPYWLADTREPGLLPVILDPGLTFGTGAHPSTQMVMEAMEELVQKGAHCLDLGSGSGILSITALRLGAKTAVGVDIDPKAEDIARENAGFNGFAAPEFTACTGNVVEDAGLMERLRRDKYDLVLVNIVADVIIGLSPVLPGLLQPESRLICSGILDTRLPDVLAALNAAGLTAAEIRAKDEWRCVIAQRSECK